MPGLLGSWNPSKTAEMVLWPVVPLGLVSVSKEAYVSSTYISFLMGLLTALLLLWWCGMCESIFLGGKIGARGSRLTMIRETL